SLHDALPISVAVDGTTQTPPLTLTNGSATYTFSSTAAGSHTIVASYSGDTTYAASSVSVLVTVTAPVASKTTLSPANSTPAAGVSDAISITVASGSASSTTTPTGTVIVSVDGLHHALPLTLTNGSATYTFSSAATG